MEAQVPRIIVALAAGVFLALAAVPASAGELSYESRGYGGPLYIGPNFQGGGQHSTPMYGAKPSMERPAAKRARSLVKRHQAPPERETSTAKETETAKETPASTEASTEKPAESESTKATDSKSTKESTPATPASSTEKAVASDSTASASASEPAASNAKKDEPAESTGPVGCKRYDATAGLTITVPCK
jgi:hypothetical protein